MQSGSMSMASKKQGKENLVEIQDSDDDEEHLSKKKKKKVASLPLIKLASSNVLKQPLYKILHANINHDTNIQELHG
jgi:hypothetical protein